LAKPFLWKNIFIIQSVLIMSEKTKPEIGSITWFDLTVLDAEKVKDFYSKVVGWKAAPVSQPKADEPLAQMGDYNDYNMNSPDSGKTNAGICHKRGGNSQLPSQWMIYITVKNAEESANVCKENGGKVLSTPKEMTGYGKFCVIEDPAGAVCTLFEPN
jgi:predicted enzyme related to lactoylglutathione lyase